jgi:hypothetical protein
MVNKERDMTIKIADNISPIVISTTPGVGGDEFYSIVMHVNPYSSNMFEVVQHDAEWTYSFASSSYDSVHAAIKYIEYRLS